LSDHHLDEKKAPNGMAAQGDQQARDPTLGQWAGALYFVGQAWINEITL
jgi:hypothetical protein